MLKQRLFFAIAPSPKQIAQLTRLQSLVSTLRVVNPDNIHLTLFYIGQCDEQGKAQICAAMSQQVWPAFEVTLTQLEWWHKPRIICATGVAKDQHLIHIVTTIEKLCIELGFEQSPHAFTPHITLLRKAKQLPLILQAVNIVLPLTLNPQVINLYHSYSTLTGVRYEILRSWPLIN